MKDSTKENANKHIFAHLLSATSTRAKYSSFSASVCSVLCHESIDGAKSLNKGINIRSSEPRGVTNVRAPHNQKNGKTAEDAMMNIHPTNWNLLEERTETNPKTNSRPCRWFRWITSSVVVARGSICSVGRKWLYMTRSLARMNWRPVVFHLPSRQWCLWVSMQSGVFKKAGIDRRYWWDIIRGRKVSGRGWLYPINHADGVHSRNWTREW